MYKSILLPVDLGQESSWIKALPSAVDLARGYSAELHVLTVFPDFGMSMVSVNFPADFEKDNLAKVSEDLQAFVKQHVPDDITIRTHVGHGTIYSEIMAAADKLGCDLIVVSSHRPEMRDYLIGPNAARVVRHAKQSVFVVRD
ncbi:MAG: universal stress protein [SAR324 cluster bacterium]|nr:universal stress protein [SAR324 cluster bacterium]MCZ6626847.1 universal stress protein [SAR324 cluster bacterium]MCZ6646340.1 universal stress protein [SAR324 cluster bacterium]